MQPHAQRLQWSSVVRLCRPRQWLKNLLVATAPLAAGILWQTDVAWRVVVLFAILCAVSSAGYIVNDIKDLSYDQGHPDKRHRPIASGEVAVSLATTLACMLTVVAIVLTLSVFGAAVCAGVIGYVVISWSYSLGLKRVAGVEMLLVASGFVARAVIGGLGTDTRLSTWFLLFIGVSALFIVAGKRLSELLRIDQVESVTTEVRRALRRYTPDYLRAIAWLSAAVAIGSYAVWALTRGVHENEPLLLLVSALPLSACFVRYMTLITSGRAEAPEEALLKDRWVVVCALAWLVIFAMSVDIGS